MVNNKKLNILLASNKLIKCEDLIFARLNRTYLFANFNANNYFSKLHLHLQLIYHLPV